MPLEGRPEPVASVLMPSADRMAADPGAAAALHALGVVALAAGEAERAAGLLREAAALAGGVAAEDAVARRLPADLVEALGRVGDAASLRACAWQLLHRGRRSSSPRVRGWAAHAAGLAAGS